MIGFVFKYILALGGVAMIKTISDNKRIQFMDGYDLYPDQFVLLGDTEEREGGTESGIILAVGDSNDRDAIWDLYFDYLFSKKHRDLLVAYYGDIDTTGVYL